MALVELLNDRECEGCGRRLRGRSAEFHEPVFQRTAIRRSVRKGVPPRVFQSIGATVEVISQVVERHPGKANIVTHNKVRCYTCADKTPSGGLSPDSWRM